jgi:hypothetical protein
MRYTLGTWIMAKYGGRFPLGTFLINVMRSFLIGVLMTVVTELRVRNVPGRAKRRSPNGAVVRGRQCVLAGYLAVWAGAVLAARR